MSTIGIVVIGCIIGAILSLWRWIVVVAASAVAALLNVSLQIALGRPPGRALLLSVCLLVSMQVAYVLVGYLRPSGAVVRKPPKQGRH